MQHFRGKCIAKRRFGWDCEA